MSLERVRLVGGALEGQVMWVENDRTAVSVHMGGQILGVTKTLHYRRSGGLLRFVEEIQTGPAPVEGSIP
ncbi:MAG: hypothetical protein A2W29_08760 [Gemmatimonadetes bacterium RBG_16_66_8]|nr:MAG: hypothetical protein A2W29_08760 [Gemmatimonadetes bacterium RBG_16_66_8]